MPFFLISLCFFFLKNYQRRKEKNEMIIFRKNPNSNDKYWFEYYLLLKHLHVVDLDCLIIVFIRFVWPCNP